MLSAVKSEFGCGTLCNCPDCTKSRASGDWRNNDSVMFPATRGPWDYAADNEMRQARIKDPARYGNSARENLGELFELDSVVGHEATDYQNPYLIVPTATIIYPAPFGTAIDPQ